MVYPRTKVLDRRCEVTSRLIRGDSPSEIACTLNVSRYTIYNDIRVIRSGKYDALFAHSREQITAQLYLNAMERARYLWAIVERETKGHVRIMALRELRLNDERIAKNLDAIHNLGKPEPAAVEPQKKPAAVEPQKAAPAKDRAAPAGGRASLHERLETLKNLELGLEDSVRKHLERGEGSALAEYLDGGNGDGGPHTAL
jgi:IS30 family transposase